jgi:tetracycline repressor-like protein
VPLPDGDLLAFAAACFDYMLAHLETARLAAWRRFEHSHWSEAERDSYQERIDAVRAAQRGGRIDGGIPAADLFATVLRMTESWLDAPAALKAVAGPEATSSARLTQHRAALLEAVRRVITPLPPAKGSAPTQP